MIKVLTKLAIEGNLQGLLRSISKKSQLASHLMERDRFVPYDRGQGKDVSSLTASIQHCTGIPRQGN
jgi:hypothetical protein